MCDVFYVMKEIIKWKEKELDVMFVFWKKFIYVVYLKEYFQDYMREWNILMNKFEGEEFLSIKL